MPPPSNTQKIRLHLYLMLPWSLCIALFFSTNGDATPLDQTQRVTKEIEQQVKQLIEPITDGYGFVVHVNLKLDESSQPPTTNDPLGPDVPAAVHEELSTSSASTIDLGLIRQRISFVDPITNQNYDSELSNQIRIRAFNVEIEFSEELDENTADLVENRLRSALLIDNNQRSLIMSYGMRDDQIQGEAEAGPLPPGKVSQSEGEAPTDHTINQLLKDDLAQQPAQGGSDLIGVVELFFLFFTASLLTVILVERKRRSKTDQKPTQPIKKPAQPIKKPTQPIKKPQSPPKKAKKKNTETHKKPHQTVDVKQKPKVIPSFAPPPAPDAPPKSSRQTEGIRLSLLIKLVEEKIEVLLQEKNHAFIQPYLNLIEADIASAAAILVNLDLSVIQKFVTLIPSEYAMALEKMIESKDGENLARSLRYKALSEYYAVIAMEEFKHTPLKAVLDIGWILRLTTADLTNLALSLDDHQRLHFLTLFRPGRLALIMESTYSQRQQDMLTADLKKVDLASKNKVIALLPTIKEIYIKERNERIEKTAAILEGDELYSRMMKQLSQSDEASFYDATRDREDHISHYSQYFIPFSELEFLSQDTLQEIFASRTPQQIAKMIFNTSKDLQNRVLEALPSDLHLPIQEQLEQLEMDPKHEMQAKKLQDKISGYLLEINRIGQLKYRIDHSCTTP